MEENENIYEKIVKHFKAQGLKDDEIAFNILRDIAPIPLIDFVLEHLSEEEALNYYKSILEEENLEEREKETRYKVAIYETKDDYEQGEPFQYELFSNLEEAEKELNRVMKKTNYYSGFVLDRKTGIEEYAYYSDEKIKDNEESEEEEL